VDVSLNASGRLARRRKNSVILVLLLMIASLVLVFLGLATDITTRTQGTSPFVHMVLTYAGLLVTLLAHCAAFLYIIGLRKLLLAEPPTDGENESWSDANEKY
jgi:hypothetical protein